MNSDEKLVTFVQDSLAYVDHPWFALSPLVLSHFERGAEQFLPHKRRNLERILLAFDCYLHINKYRSFEERDLLDRQVLKQVIEGFIGALHSNKFIALSPPRRFDCCTVFHQALLAISAFLPLPICTPPRSRKDRHEQPDQFKLDIRISAARERPTPFVIQCKKKFEAQTQFDEHAIWVWRGWPSTNLSGKTTWLRLYPIYKRVGKHFVERLYEQCDRYFSNRRGGVVPILTYLARFIGDYPDQISEDDFRSSEFMTQFWPKFLIFYITTGDDEGLGLTFMAAKWRGEFIFFVEEFLVKNGVVAESYGKLPAPPSGRGPGHRTNIKKTDAGSEIHAKLLVHIPLKITDAQAMHLIFEQLRDHFDLILLWAREAAADLWERRNRRLIAAKEGTVRPLPKGGSQNNGSRWLTARNNPQQLSNSCATYEAHGHLCSRDTTVGIVYPRPLCTTARALGLPISGSLLPHCAILIAIHPAITPAFLEQLELYDKNGQLTGIVHIDGNAILRSAKKRKGSHASWQEIQLTPETENIVMQVIAITEPLRKYLRARNDDNWRFLLLTCEQGFAYPRRISRLATDTSEPTRLKNLADEIRLFTDKSYKDSEAITKTFSLSTLRATAGVLIYLHTRDVSKMAHALGHTTYNRNLLSRYLPDAILEFFQDRWIRIFQTCVVIDAMKDSSYLLPATGFKDISELNEFLENHMLKKLPSSFTSSSTSNDENNIGLSSSKILFGLDVSVLTALVSLQLSVQSSKRNLNDTAAHWYNISSRLTSFIDSDFCERDDLKFYLRQARANASPESMERVLYD